MVSQQRIFFDFLQFCIGSGVEIPVSVKEADWNVLYTIAKKQALVGVLFHGIKQLPKELASDEDLLMTWMGMAQMNADLNALRYEMKDLVFSSNSKTRS